MISTLPDEIDTATISIEEKNVCYWKWQSKGNKNGITFLVQPCLSWEAGIVVNKKIVIINQSHKPWHEENSRIVLYEKNLSKLIYSATGDH